MTVPDMVHRAATTHVGQPLNFGEDNNLIRLSNHDAFVAGVEWARTHPQEETMTVIEETRTHFTVRCHNTAVDMLHALEVVAADARLVDVQIEDTADVELHFEHTHKGTP